MSLQREREKCKRNGMERIVLWSLRHLQNHYQDDDWLVDEVTKEKKKNTKSIDDVSWDFFNVLSFEYRTKTIEELFRLSSNWSNICSNNWHTCDPHWHSFNENRKRTSNDSVYLHFELILLLHSWDNPVELTLHWWFSPSFVYDLLQ